jgi:hypothetical protein
VGDQATSRTQSVWPVKICVLCQLPVSALKSHSFTWQSLPPVTKRRAAPAWFPLALTICPGATAGAHDTLFTPLPQAWKIWCVHALSLNSSTETLPSEEAHARRQPTSWGVDGGGMQGNFVDLLPGRRLLAPDDDLAVVRGGCEDVAVLRVRPCDTPYRALVSVVLSVPGTCSMWR